MTKANEPAYPLNHDPGTEYADGLTKREKLAMEIYARYITDGEQRFEDKSLIIAAEQSLRAADIFFEVLNK